MSLISKPDTTPAPIYTDINSLKSIANEKSSDEALKKVAQEFESIFVNLMFKQMRSANAVFEKDSLFHSQESEYFRDMQDQQMALNLAHGQGIGLAKVLYTQMKRDYGAQVDAFNASQQPIDHSWQNSLRSLQRQQEAEPTQNIKASGDVLGPDSYQSLETNGDVSADLSVDESQVQFSSPADFIRQILPGAKKVASALGLDPLMMLAQAALETGWGKHIISQQDGSSSHNLFNIKASDAWQGAGVNVSTLEFKNGIAQKEKANFRVYESLEHSMEDFAQFIQKNPRYEQALLSATNPQQFINELHKAGYATDPDYADKVISVYERLKTQDLELQVDGNG